MINPCEIDNQSSNCGTDLFIPLENQNEDYFSNENSQDDSVDWYSHMDKNLWYNLCRICATHDNHLIPIYESLEQELNLKLSLFFPYEVSENDGLPKHCCHLCASTILAWRDFIILSKNANEKLICMRNCFVSDNSSTDKETEVTVSNKKGNSETVVIDGQTIGRVSVADINVNNDKIFSNDEACISKFTKNVCSVSEVKTTDKKTVENKPEDVIETPEFSDLNCCNAESSSRNEISLLQTEQNDTDGEDFQYNDSIFDLRNDDDHITTIHRVADGDGKKSNRRRGMVEPELQAYKLHMPLKYLSINGHQFLRTKVFGFEPENVPEGSEDVNALYFICCLCNKVMKDTEIINHSKSHYPLKLLDSCKICHFKFNSIDYFRLHLKKHTVFIDEECRKPVQNGNFAQEIKNVTSLKPLDKLNESFNINSVNNENVSFIKKEILLPEENGLVANTICVEGDPDPFVCEYCGLTFKVKKMFIQHIKRSHLSPYICKVCNKRFAVKVSLKKHKCIKVIPKRPGSKIKWLNCKCKKIFLFEDQYLEHVKLCEKAKYLPCKECGREFPDKIKLEMHVLKQHIKLKEIDHQVKTPVWMCEICGCHLSAVSARKHYITHSFAEKKFTCYLCGMKFSENKGLENHIQSHSDERPFICNICNQTFKRKDHLKIHMKNKHNIYEDRRYECRKCKRYFTTHSYLIRHQRLHSLGVSYECSVCGSRYPTEQTLKMHQTRAKHDKASGDTTVSLKSADWANKYRCNVCNRRYGSINSLRKHTLIHHKKTTHDNNGSKINEDTVNEDDKNLDDLIENVYECPKCNKRFLSKFGLNLHLSRSKHASVTVVSKKRNKLGRVVKVEKNPRFKCNECNKIFSTLLSLKMHKIKRRHSSKCPDCDKRFALDYKLRNHLIKVHHKTDVYEKISEFTQAEIMPYQCEFCRQNFAMEHNYLAHMARKHNEKEPNTFSVSYIVSDIFEQGTANDETPIVYHCTECLDNFFTEEEFHNHTHETTSIIVLDDSSEHYQVNTEIAKHDGILEIVPNQSIPVISNNTN